MPSRTNDNVTITLTRGPHPHRSDTMHTDQHGNEVSVGDRIRLTIDPDDNNGIPHGEDRVKGRVRCIPPPLSRAPHRDRRREPVVGAAEGLRAARPRASGARRRRATDPRR